jgi:hypothetical protein
VDVDEDEVVDVVDLVVDEGGGPVVDVDLVVDEGGRPVDGLIVGEIVVVVDRPEEEEEDDEDVEESAVVSNCKMNALYSKG